MSFAAVPLLFSALFAPASSAQGAAPASATRVQVASTYDQATCATVRAGDDTDDTDGWALAAIGEDAPPAQLIVPDCRVPVRPMQLAADCNDPLVSRLSVWMTSDMIGTCDMPRGNGTRPGLRAARGDSRRSARPLVDLSASDSPRPLAPSIPDRELGPLLVATAPQLVAPQPTGTLYVSPTPSLQSIFVEQLLRPPRA